MINFVNSNISQLLATYFASKAKLLSNYSSSKISAFSLVIIIALFTNGCNLTNLVFQASPSNFDSAINNKSLVVGGKSIFTKKELFDPNNKSELVFYEFTVLDNVLSKESLNAKTEIKLVKNYLEDGLANTKPVRLLYDDKKSDFDSLYKSFKQFNKIDWLKFHDDELYIDEDNDENNLKDNDKANFLQINAEALSQDTSELAVYSLKYNDGSLRKYILPSIASKTAAPLVLSTAPVSHLDIPNQEMQYLGDVFMFLAGARSVSDRRGHIIADQQFNVKIVGKGTTKSAEISAEIDLQQSLFSKTNTAFVDKENEKFDHISIKNFNFTQKLVDVDGARKLAYEGLTFLDTQNSGDTTVTNPYKVASASFIFAGVNHSQPEELAVMMIFTKKIKDNSLSFGDFSLTFGGRLK